MIPPAPTNSRTQFSLLGLVALASLFGVVCGLLAAMGAPPVQALLGFVLFGGIAATVAVVVELFAQLLGMRGRND